MVTLCPQQLIRDRICSRSVKEELGQLIRAGSDSNLLVSALQLSAVLCVAVPNP